MAQRAKDAEHAKPWMADALTLTGNADQIAKAVTDTCDVSSSFAAMVDKVTNAGPYAALITVGISVGAQLAANHGMAIGKALGGKDPDEVIASAQESIPEKAPDAGVAS
jgi:hypothetical protein